MTPPSVPPSMLAAVAFTLETGGIMLAAVGLMALAEIIWGDRCKK